MTKPLKVPKKRIRVRQYKQRGRPEIVWQKKVLADMEILFEDSPPDPVEFSLALDEMRPNIAVTQDMRSKLYTRLNTKMAAKWKANGSLATGSVNCRVYQPCHDFVATIAEVTGLTQSEVLDFIVRDFAGQMFAGRLNLVEIIVAAKLQSNSVISAVNKLLTPISLATDDRLKNFQRVRLEHRKRQVNFSRMVNVVVTPDHEVV